MSLQKYIQYKDQKDWEKAVRTFQQRSKINAKKEYDANDKVLSYFSGDKIIAVWDFMDNEGWVMSMSYFATNGEFQKMYDEL
jgi:hypothetical protein